MMSVIEIFQTGATGRVIILNLEQVVHAGPKPKQHSSRSSIPEPADVYVRDKWERTHHLRRCVVLLVFLGLILTLNSILCVQDSLTEVCQAVFLHRPQSLE